MHANPIPRHLRAAFEANLADERVRSMRESCVLSVILYSLFGILDVWAIPSALHEVWLIRAIVALMLVGLLWSTYFPFFTRHYVPMAVGMFLSLGLGIEAMVYLAGPDDLAKHFYYTGLILVVMALYAWSLMKIWQSTATGFTLVALYVLIALLVQDMGNPREWPILLTNCFFFVSANIIGIYSNAMRGRYLRESFLLRQALITDLKRTQAEKKESQFWSEHDSLTGLPNRKYLMPRLDGAIAKAAEAGTKLALLFIDLDGFKAINDQLGHATGDAVLRVVGKRLVSCVREHDLVARIGGDEFVVVLTIDADLDEGVLRVADSIITAIEDPIRDPDIGQMLSGSIGIAFFPVDGATADALLTAADRRLYEAKRQGHGSISLAQC